MNLSDIELNELIIDVAKSEFDGRTFTRRALMSKVEQVIREKGYWSEDDDLLSGSRGEKSKGLEKIDYAFMPLEKIYGCLDHVGRDTWRVIGTIDRATLPVGIIMKLSFGTISGLYPDTYLQELFERANSDRLWNLPSEPKALVGGGKKILLYDKNRKGITAEFIVEKIVKTDIEPAFPWSCYIVPESVKKFVPQIDIEFIGTIEGLESFSSNRAPYRNLTEIQYSQLQSIYKREQIVDSVVDGMKKQGPDFYRLRNSLMMDRRKAKDNYTCQSCGFYLKTGDSYIIECHHINPISEGERKTCIDDLISLCPTCHRIAHANRQAPLNIAQIQEIRNQIVQKAV